MQIPHDFLQIRCEEAGFALPAPGHYGVGAFFTSPIFAQQEFGKRLFETIVVDEGQTFLGWRRLHTHNATLGESAKRRRARHVARLRRPKRRS